MATKTNHPRRGIPQHRRHKSNDRGYVRLDGKQIYTGKWGTAAAQRKAEELIAAYLRDEPVGPVELPSDYLLEDLAADYLKHHVSRSYKKEGRPTRERENIRIVLERLLQVFAKIQVSDFTPGKLVRFRDMLQDVKIHFPNDGKRAQRDLCRSTINSQIGIVKRMIRWGMERERVDGSVGHALLAVASLRRGQAGVRESPGVGPVAEADWRAILPHVSRQVAAMIQLQALTGMRPGEVVQMRRKDLTQVEQGLEYRPQRHKTEHHGKDRVVLLGKEAIEIIRPFFQLDPEALLFRPLDAERERRENQLRTRLTKETPSQSKRRKETARRPKRRYLDTFTTQSYGHTIARGCMKAGVPHWSPNQLRHTAGTRIAQKHGMEIARLVLGHADLRSTAVYAEVDRAIAWEAVS